MPCISSDARPGPAVAFAAGAGLPVIRFDPQSRGALDFRLLAQELTDAAPDLAVADLGRWVELLHGPEVTQRGVRFRADFPGAQSVSLTGSFTAWSAEGRPLTRRHDGLWECELPLPAGAHEYRYIVDGTWSEDPHNTESVPNEFGSLNSLVTVP